MTKPRDVQTIFETEAFQIESLRGDRTRTVWMLLFLIVVLVQVFLRTIMTDTGEASWQVPSAAALGFLAILYEGIMLVLVSRRLRDGERMPEWIVRLNTVAESGFPTLVIFVLLLIPSVAPNRALVSPAVGIYFAAIILSTLRLRPSLCLLAGAVSGVGYALAFAFALLRFRGTEAATEMFHPSIYGAWAVLLVLAGFLAAGVAMQIRRHAGRALLETHRRQQAEIHSRDSLIFGLAKLAEYRDTDTGAHLERIATYSGILAEALRDERNEIDNEWIRTLKVASSMHDIGKVGIPDNVLLKPGRLDPDERLVIEKHAGIGAETLEAIVAMHGDDPLLSMSAEIARGHHERWDGKGYPGKIPASEISLAARIISVADVYDALTSPRVYKPALSHEESCRIIREGRGSQFDPQVLDAFERVANAFDEVRARQHGSLSADS